METIVVVKIGGNIIDDKKALADFLLNFSKINSLKILIHGGGKIASEISKQLNIEPKLIDGRRITDEKTLDVVSMVYAGLINKKIVAQLQALNCNAIGFTGADANSILAHKRIHTKMDYGFVGDIDMVNTEFIVDLLSKKYIPVIAPITHDKNGNLLNTNADSVASEISIALSKDKKVHFFYCFEKRGLLKDINNNDSVMETVSLEEIQQLKEKQIITDGMLPKMDTIAHALKNGVEKVILCHADDILSNVNENAKFGTTFTKD